MKLILSLVLVIFCLLCCTATPVYVPTPTSTLTSTPTTTTSQERTIDPLDETILRASHYIEERLDQDTQVALININSPSDIFSEYVLTLMEYFFVYNKKLVVVDRSNLDKIRQEQGFQLSGEVSDESAKAIGQIIGAGAIITGTLINIGDSYRLTLKAINVKTATIVASYPTDIPNNLRVRALLASGSTATTARQTQTITQGNTTTNTQTQTVTQATTSQSAVVPAYKIGDTGPAGGLIFYDKGNNTGGWRYLEAASSSSEVRVIWSREDIPQNTINSSDSVINQRTIGLGKSNTRKLMNTFNNRGGGFDTAARYCDDLVLNGFDDWFLPSFDELSWIYGNLHRKGLGEFKNEQDSYYWSSTQTDYWRAYSIDFYNGNRRDSNIINPWYVRAIRQF